MSHGGHATVLFAQLVGKNKPKNAMLIIVDDVTKNKNKKSRTVFTVNCPRYPVVHSGSIVTRGKKDALESSTRMYHVVAGTAVNINTNINSTVQRVLYTECCYIPGTCI